MRGPQSGRRCRRETFDPTTKTRVASWPGVKSLTFPQRGALYSIVGEKGHKLGHPAKVLEDT